MRIGIFFSGLALFSATLLLSVLYQNESGFMVAILFQLFSVVVTRDALATRRWFTPLWLVWSGVTFLGAGWLQASEGLQVDAAFRSFGPGYLIMAVLALLWPKGFSSGQSQNVKDS